MSLNWEWTKIEIHPLFWLIGALSIVTAQFESMFIIFVLVFLHECAHILVMMKFRWKIHKIVLLPFGGVAQTDEFATRPFYEEWYVVLACDAGIFLFVRNLCFSFAVRKCIFMETDESNDFIGESIAGLSA